MSNLLFSILAFATQPTALMPSIQNSKVELTNYIDNNKEIKVFFILNASARVSTFGMTGHREAISDEKKLIEWEEYAKNKNDFIEKYPTVKLWVSAKLWESGVLQTNEITGTLTFNTKELFSEKEYTKTVNGYSQSVGGFNASGNTFFISLSDEKAAYIKIGASVSGGWDSKERFATAKIQILSASWARKIFGWYKISKN